MELYQLKTFVQVAEEGNLTRAAEKLFTSQPAISAQIKALEEELGVELFQRSARGMTLTEAGSQLDEYARRTLASAEAMKQQARALQNELLGEPRIGVHTDFEFVRVGALYQGITRAHPQVRPHFVQGMSLQIVQDIRKGALDGGFFFGPCRSADLHIVHLMDIPMRIVGPAGWQERIETAALDQLAQMPWVYTTETCPIHEVGRQLFASIDSGPVHTAYADSEDAVRELIRSGAGLSLLREDDAANAVRSGFGYCWSGEVPDIALQFAVQERRLAEPLIKALLSQVKRVWDVDAPMEAEVAR